MAILKRSWFKSNDEKKKKISEQLKEKGIEEVDGKDVGGGKGNTADVKWPTNPTGR